MPSTRKALALIFALALCVATAASAQQVTSGGASWTAQKSASTLTVSGPDGTFSVDFAAGETPFLNVNDLADGGYTWELKTNAPALERGDRERRVAPQLLFGHLTVQGGAFLDPTAVEDAEKAQVFNTDLIVEGSACVGVDCTSSESFGFDTIRMKENNLRIKFDDTSSSGSFPNNDWQLTANESGNGGLNKFSIDDITGGKTPFTLEANAPSHSLYVDDGGRLGLGTSAPAGGVRVHVVDGNTPALRLEQDGSNGFQTQTWDMAGNETVFFVRDVTGGSNLPFKIETGSPDNTLYVDSNARVGVNKQNPAYTLDVNGDAAISGSLIGDTTVSGGGVKLNLEDTTNSTTWFLQSDSASDTLLISKSGSGGGEIRIDQRQDGGVGPTLFVDGSIQATNVTFSSTRSKKADFESVDPQDVLNRLDGIDIQTWRYKTEDEEIRHMGPIAEDFAAAFGLGTSDTTITVTDVNGVALAAIQALSQEIRTLKERNSELETLVQSLVEGR